MTRPTHSGIAVTRSRRRCLAVVKELVPGLVVRCAHARKESNPVVGVGDRDVAVTRAHDEERA
jgi:hypothetical protein